MNLDEQKKRFLSGELPDDEAQVLAQEVDTDTELRAELGDQLSIDAALSVALGGVEGERALVDSVQDELRGRAVPAPVPFAWRALKYAALLVVSLAGGWIFGGLTSEKRVAQFEIPTIDPADVEPVALDSRLTHEWRAFRQLENVETAEEFAALFAEIEASKGTVSKPRRDRMVELLFYRWVQKDAREALAFAQEQGADVLLTHVFAAWSRLDPNAAFAEAAELPRVLAHRVVFAQLAEHDPEAFVANAGAAESINASAWAELFRNVPVSEADVILTGLEPDQRTAAILGLAVAKAEAGAEAAIDWASALGDEGERKSALDAVLEKIAERDPDAVGKALASLDGDFRAVVKKIAKGMGLDAPREALQWARKYTEGETRTTAYYAVLREAAMAADNSVFDMMDELVALDGLENVFTESKELNMAGVPWWSSELDYRRGIEWAVNLPDETFDKNNIIAGMTNGWMKSLKSQPGAYREVAEHIRSASDDPEVLTALNLGLIHQLAGRHGRDTQLMKIFEKYAYSNHDKALERLEGLPDPEQRDQAIPILAKAWSEGTPAEAAAWAEALPDGDAKADAYANIAKSWSEFDSYAASQWVDMIPGGAPRDAAIEQLVGQVAQFDGDAAFKWATTIGDQTRRKATLATAVSAWSKQDPDAALEAIDLAVEIDPQDKAELIQTATATQE